MMQLYKVDFGSKSIYVVSDSEVDFAQVAEVARNKLVSHYQRKDAGFYTDQYKFEPITSIKLISSTVAFTTLPEETDATSKNR